MTDHPRLRAALAEADAIVTVTNTGMAIADSLAQRYADDLITALGPKADAMEYGLAQSFCPRCGERVQDQYIHDRLLHERAMFGGER